MTLIKDIVLQWGKTDNFADFFVPNRVATKAEKMKAFVF